MSGPENGAVQWGVSEMADAAQRHAEAIMKAAGSSLRHYETVSKKNILMAVMDCIEEVYQAGSAHGVERAMDHVALLTERAKGGEG